MTADNGEMNDTEIKEHFRRFGIKINFATSWNPEGNAKSERGHPPIVEALAKSCENPRHWPLMLCFAFLADRTTHCSTHGFMPMQLMKGITPIFPVEEDVVTWGVLPWKAGISKAELLAIRIRQLERRPTDIAEAIKKLKECRIRNADNWNAKHRLRPVEITAGDWVVLWDASLDNSHEALRKFKRRWFGPYVVKDVHKETGTYRLAELDGALFQRRVAGKHVKLFKRRDKEFDWAEVVDFGLHEAEAKAGDVVENEEDDFAANTVLIGSL